MNRILQFLSRECSCCHRLAEIERALDRAAIEAERLEALAGGAFEFWIPDAARVLKPKPDDDDDVGIRLLVGIEPTIAPIDCDLVQYAVDELRRMAGELSAAADAIGGAA